MSSEKPAPYPVDMFDGCPCLRCQEPTWPELWPGFKAARMTLCPQCGNKRCPGARDHDNECSGSNEPGQAGSNYENAIRPGETRPMSAQVQIRMDATDPHPLKHIAELVLDDEVRVRGRGRSDRDALADLAMNIWRALS